MTDEISVKGIILSANPQGEYGRRLVIISDKLGKISAFASGAAKQGSKIVGAVRPLTCGEFSLKRGRSAWNLHSVKVMDAFSELSLDPDVCFYAFYVLEVSGYFSDEGMVPPEARELLNLMYVTFDALRGTINKGLELTPELIRRMFELRLLKLEGEYTLEPENEAEWNARRLWTYTLSSPLSKLYKNIPMDLLSNYNGFLQDVRGLFKRQVGKSFNSEKLLLKL